MSSLDGHDRYSGSTRRVTVEHEAAHVALTVAAYDGDGEVLLTPAQARAVARWLEREAQLAEMLEELAPDTPQ